MWSAEDGTSVIASGFQLPRKFRYKYTPLMKWNVTRVEKNQSEVNEREAPGEHGHNTTCDKVDGARGDRGQTAADSVV